MDADELADLRGHLDRALAKERAHRSIAEKGGAPCLPVRLASTN
jgi:hypothetical protein